MGYAAGRSSFFALMSVMYFLTTYLQSVMGYSALQAGIRMVPIAVGLILASKLSVALTARVGTKAVVAGGLAVVGISLGAFTGVDVDTPYFTKVAGALTMMGVGMGLAMAPATEAIMGSLPRTKAGIGSAMNDVVRELGGTLGVAVLGSIVSTGYASGMDGATAGVPRRWCHQGLRRRCVREAREVVPGATDDREVIKRAVAGCDGVLVVLVPRGGTRLLVGNSPGGPRSRGAGGTAGVLVRVAHHS